MTISKPIKLKVDELETDIGVIKGLEVSVGRLVTEEEWEPIGPTPFPSITDLRSWDLKLLKRYQPLYAPLCDMCCLCSYAKCDLSRDRRGACGIDIGTQQARIVLLACSIGAAAHTAHAKHLLEHLIDKYGSEYPIDFRPDIIVEAPLTRTVCGVKPNTLGDLVDVVDWCGNQITDCLAAVLTGQESSHLDFESKALHVSMVDSVAMEVADISQIVAYNFPKGDPQAPLVEIGMGAIDREKPVVLCIGHNVSSGVEAVDYLWEARLEKEVEVVGICCTALDLTRYTKRAKIVGPLSHQLRFVRSGVADVIVIDAQCVRTDILQEARLIGTRVIATSNKICMGLEDRTKSPTDEVVRDLVNGEPGVLILDPRKAGEVAVKVAIEIAPDRRRLKGIGMTEAELWQALRRCIGCGECERVCPVGLPITDAIRSASRIVSTGLINRYTGRGQPGDHLEPLARFYEKCVGCGRCEKACQRSIPIHSIMLKASKKMIEAERHVVRAGRGPIRDTEIRAVGGPIVLGEIPGIIAYVGCPNYTNGYSEVGRMAEEFLKRRYIVVASGCAAMDIARYRTEDGKSLYEKHLGNFDAGCLINVGSCVSNSWIAGAAVKIASIFAKRNLRANFEEIADYILNRVGACGVAWGAMSQKAVAIGTGFNRWGVPVILGPQGSKYRRMYLGRKEREEDWIVYNARTGEKVYVGPSFEHLTYVAESAEECMVMTAKFCMRPADTTKGRAIKLNHYIDLHKRFFGALPDDLHLYVRTKWDIPITMKDEVMGILEKKGWKERAIPDPTLLKRLVRHRG